MICQNLGQHGARLEVVSLHVVHLDFQSRERMSEGNREW